MNTVRDRIFKTWCENFHISSDEKAAQAKREIELQRKLGKAFKQEVAQFLDAINLPETAQRIRVQERQLQRKLKRERDA